MKINNLNLVKELSETDKTIQEQEQEFIIKTQKCRSTFYRYRKRLGLKTNTKKVEYKLKDIGSCYFCLKDAKQIHHINKDRSDNSKQNLLPLCGSCHNKIHRVLTTQNKVAKVA